MGHQREVIITEKLDNMIDDQLEWYIENSDDPRVPERFIVAIEDAVKEISAYPEHQSKFLITRKEFHHLNQYGLWRKKIGPKFPWYLYYQFDDSTITLRFLFRDRRNTETEILKNIKNL